tara:strand:- start:359 stop:712 length:354 start_codon:yes stop_codon:yes gene_type:complete
VSQGEAAAGARWRTWLIDGAPVRVEHGDRALLVGHSGPSRVARVRTEGDAEWWRAVAEGHRLVLADLVQAVLVVALQILDQHPLQRLDAPRRWAAAAAATTLSVEQVVEHSLLRTLQ